MKMLDVPKNLEQFVSRRYLDGRVFEWGVPEQLEATFLLPVRKKRVRPLFEGNFQNTRRPVDAVARGLDGCCGVGLMHARTSANAYIERIGGISTTTSNEIWLTRTPHRTTSRPVTKRNRHPTALTPNTETPGWSYIEQNC
jgi:hypothetical protein